LDICCGTGSIGIALETYFDFVFGVEMEKSAIEDANQNVELNGLKEKCNFILGKAEDKVLDICEAASQVAYLNKYNLFYEKGKNKIFSKTNNLEIYSKYKFYIFFESQTVETPFLTGFGHMQKN